MRKLVCTLLIMSMLLAVCAAQAAESHMTHFDLFDSDDGTVNGLAYWDGVLVATTDQNKYFSIDPMSEYRNATYQLNKKLLASEEPALTAQWGVIPGDDGLYMLFSYVYITDDEILDADSMRIVLRRFDLNSHSKLELAEEWELDWESVVDALGDYAVHAALTGACITGGRLVGNISDLNGREYIAVFDFTGDECRLIPSKATVHCAYQNGRALISECDYSADDSPVYISAFDPVGESSETLCQIPSKNYYGPEHIAYNAASDTLFYVIDSTLHRMTSMDPSTAETLCSVFVNTSMSTLAIAPDAAHYISASGSLVTMYDTSDAISYSSRVLRVSDAFGYFNMNYGDAATQAFSQANPDVAVRSVDSCDAIDAMLTQSPDVDIYLLQADDTDYAALYQRGFLAELDESAPLSDYVSATYPFIQEHIAKDGHVLAVPVYYFVLNGLSCNTPAMEELGLSADDMPATWPELMQFMQTLPPLLAENGVVSMFPQKYSYNDVRKNLLDCLIDNYMLYMHSTGQELTFDTPLLRGLLSEFEKIDFTALGLAEDAAYSSYYANEVLLEFGQGIMPGISYSSGAEYPLVLALDAGLEPVIPAQLGVAVVNPFSEHRELAIEYIEYIAANNSDELNAAISPGLNIPVRSANYEENMAYYDEQIALAEAELEKASEEDKAEWYEQLALLRQSREEYMNGDDAWSWELSAESIAWYRSYDGYFHVLTSYGMDLDAQQVFYDLRSQYVDGKITMDEFISTIDARLNMMILEAQ